MDELLDLKPVIFFYFEIKVKNYTQLFIGILRYFYLIFSMYIWHFLCGGNMFIIIHVIITSGGNVLQSQTPLGKTALLETIALKCQMFHAFSYILFFFFFLAKGPRTGRCRSNSSL